MQPLATIASAVALAASFTLAAGTFTPALASDAAATPESAAMELGNFSVSLAVKDIAASKAFYEKLGFTVFGGVQEQNWLIMKSGTTKIGLFQGMFEQNLFTLNPGWDSDAKPLEDFQDVRDIQALLKERGVTLITEADPDSTGPASMMVVDPDGNSILFDQHVARPER
jgi:catechol 2,3-dioxygenase-like lactoylglutathione lyase family enzyme